MPSSWRVLPLLAVLFAGMASAAEGDRPLPPLAQPPALATGQSGTLDPLLATKAYLDTVPATARARSNAYVEGGYWLMLWQFLYTAAALLLLLASGFSSALRDFTGRWSRFFAPTVAVYGIGFTLALWVLSFPLDVYSGFVREHAYGLSNMTFAAWMGDELKGLLVSAVTAAITLPILYLIVRRAKRSWWLVGGVVAIGFLSLVVLVSPVLIEPLFNTERPLADARVRDPILSLARANGLAAREVWEIDESRQSKRISAHVSGLLGTERIALNDNLVNQCSLEEIEAVMGHEMGHAVLHHPYALVLELGLVAMLGLAFVSFSFERLRARYAARFGVKDIADPAGLPLAFLLLYTFLFLATPVLNGIIRVHEQEADYFGLNVSRQPDGAAQVALKIAAYRKLEPGPLEEAIFYDHPSGRTRIHAAMRWKAEHPETWQRTKVGSE